MKASEPLKYRKRPVVIEAAKFDGIGADMPMEFQAAICHGACFGSARWDATPQHIHTLEGPHHVAAGDWIIKGIKGEMYPCKPDIFEATYEPADRRALSPVVAEVAKALRQDAKAAWAKAGQPKADHRGSLEWLAASNEDLADRLERGE